MKKILLSLLLLIFVPFAWNVCLSQSIETVPKNFIGLFAGVEMTTTSILTGIEFERVVWEKNKFIIGMKGVKIFKHSNGNMIMYSGGDYGSSSFMALMPTFHYFTSRYRKDNNGFFLHSGMGIGWRHESVEKQYYRTVVGFETGVGLQFDLGAQASIKWTSSVLFAGEGGIALSKISLGF